MRIVTSSSSWYNRRNDTPRQRISLTLSAFVLLLAQTQAHHRKYSGWLHFFGITLLDDGTRMRTFFSAAPAQAQSMKRRLRIIHKSTRATRDRQKDHTTAVPGESRRSFCDSLLSQNPYLSRALVFTWTLRDAIAPVCFNGYVHPSCAVGTSNRKYETLYCFRSRQGCERTGPQTPTRITTLPSSFNVKTTRSAAVPLKCSS